MTNNLKSPIAQSFTISADRRVNVIPTKLGVSEPIADTNIVIGDPRINEITAIWDTGATGSVITKDTARKLNLKPTGLSQVCHFGGISENVNVYLVNFYLPNKVVIQNVRVTECDDTEGRYDALIGMDIITLGDFAITNPNGKTVISYQFPSLNNIDFVKNSIISANSPTSLTPGRNALCPCGSGKKFKHCCIGKPPYI